jgi:hypothetical protein
MAKPTAQGRRTAESTPSPESDPGRGRRPARLTPDAMGLRFPPMADEIIDISRYLDRDAPKGPTPATMALWGADGERSRFALPLWRVVHLSQATRGVILWKSQTVDPTPHPFVVVDLARDPARLELSGPALDHCIGAESATLHDLGPDGLVVYLGSRDGRAWYLIADGDGSRAEELEAHKREDVLFLAGECAGLLFLRDFADGADIPSDDE